MKRFGFFVLIVSMFSACGNSSDGDYIIGNWKVKSITVNGVTTETLDECDANSSYKFSANGRFQSLGAYANQDGEFCLFSGANKWLKINDYYTVNESYPDLEQPVVHGKLTKVGKDSLRAVGNDPNITRILVRQ